MSEENKAMLASWAKVFVLTLIASFLALQTAPWNLSGDQWLAVLWSGGLALINVVYNWLDSKDPRYGRGYVAPVVVPVAAPQARAAAPKAAPAKKTAAPAAKKAPAKKAPAKKAAPKKATGK